MRHRREPAPVWPGIIIGFALAAAAYFYVIRDSQALVITLEPGETLLKGVLRHIAGR